MKTSRTPNDFRPTSRRQRLVIVAVTAATVVTLWYLLLERPGFHVKPLPGTGPQPCAKGQTSGCVGGRADVLLMPAAAASAAASGTR
ncbi:MAG: hypothetical protein U1F53_03545 [Burkholderiaceae bacterium]